MQDDGVNGGYLLSMIRGVRVQNKRYHYGGRGVRVTVKMRNGKAGVVRLVSEMQQRGNNS